MPHAARAVRILVAELLFVGRRLRHAHLAPVSFELIGNDQRQPGADALPHLGAMHGDGHDAVFADRDEDQRIVTPAVRHAVGAVLRRVLRLDDAGGCARTQGPGPTGTRKSRRSGPDVKHDSENVRRSTKNCALMLSAPARAAACLMAARMRG